MTIANTYPVFEADQVLTNDHLNGVVNYLDQQDRLTRIKLIGSGIVCGLEITPGAGEIKISKGCAVTSQGFMLLHCETIYTHYVLYTPPAFPQHLPFMQQCSSKAGGTVPFYGEAFNQDLFQLITENDANNNSNTDPVALSQVPDDFLDKYAVVLFLEAEELNLKNCDTNDCNDKGSRMNFQVKALLVNKDILDKIIKMQGGSIAEAVSDVYPVLKRYNVPVQKLTTASDVLLAFKDLADKQTLTAIATALKNSARQYQYLLENENPAVFDTAYDQLTGLRDEILKNYPVLIQYFYDYLDDLIKAYYEFTRVAEPANSECCLDEMKFPLHMMLGEADTATSNRRSVYRQYFIYSPLFNDQKNRLAELRSLFTRLKLLLAQFSVDNMLSFEKKQIRITPSRYSKASLSDRCIPYYYEVAEAGKELYRCWNYNKTKRGEETRNLSYNAAVYNAPYPVINPLLYDIEPFNFFRVEGHIGKNINEALPVVKQEQQDKNLPFEIAALSADYIGALVRGEEPTCIIQDLESDYRVLIAEFVCKLHDAYCKVGRTEYKTGSIFTGTVLTGIGTNILTGTGTILANRASIAGGIAPEPATRLSAITPEEEEEETKILKTSLLLNTQFVSHPFVSSLVSEFHASKAYRKGDTLSRLCRPSAETVGAAYIALVNKNNGQFKNPISISTSVLGSFLRNVFFELIDSIESMFEILMNHELADFEITVFKTRYERYETAIESVATRLARIGINTQIFLSTCITEQLEALKNEYLRRTAQYRLAKNFSYYFSRHGGIEHKAGVPRGGTFILVYHEERKRQLFDVRSILINKDLRSMLLQQYPALLQTTHAVNELETKTQEIQAAIQFKEPELFLRLNDVVGKYLAECRDLPEARRKELEAIIKLPPQRTAFTLTDGMVIADFYIPYLCCSDCPPIAYILPPPPVTEDQTPVLKIAKNSFCNKDETEFGVTAVPAGGILEGDGIKKRADGTFVFVPAGLSAGAHTIKYTLNQKSASATVQVTATPTAQFSTEKNIAEGEMKIVITNTSAGTNDQTTYTWLKNDAAFSEKKDPGTLTISLDELPVTILLRTSNNGCPSEFKEDIKLVTTTKSLKVCSNVRNQKLEASIPAGAVIAVLKNDDAIMNDKLVIFPSKMAVTKTTVFNVSYAINERQTDIAITVVAANADFSMELKQAIATINVPPITLTVGSLGDSLAVSTWKIAQDTIAITDILEGKPILLNRFILDKPIVVTHIAEVKSDALNCPDEKTFNITINTVQLHLNKGPFDNNAIA